MIVPMKKIYLIVQNKDVKPALQKVRDWGLLHVEHQEDLEAPHLQDLRTDIDTVTQVTIFIRQRLKEKKASAREAAVNKAFKQHAIDPLEESRKFVLIRRQMEQRQSDLIKQKIAMSQWDAWGDFDPEDFHYLKNKGLHAGLYESPLKAEVDMPEGVYCEPVGQPKGVKRWFVIAPEDVDVPMTRVDLPARGLSQMRARQQEDEAALKDMERQLDDYIPLIEEFEGALTHLQNTLRFEEAQKGMKDFERLSLLRGFCPAPEADALKEKAQIEQWGIHIEEPAEDDPVPTLLKNPRWIQIIQPVFNMINVLPGYREIDVSSVFLLFFALFVGMLVGDAGYGLLVLGIFAGFHVKMAKQHQNIPTTNFVLVYVLCACTIIWGVLTGTFFGQEWISPAFKPMVPWLTDGKNVQVLCFFIGAVQLSIAHIWNALIKLPSLKALSDLGWVLILWGMYYVAKLLILDMSMPFYSLVFLMGGAALVLFFTKPSKNILKAIGPGLGDILLNGINSFTDVVSYIRLYAVGLATVAVADAANEMSIAWVILLHTVNLILAGLAILVHGIRLNILEFSASHLNLEWSGFKFNPFRKT
jgi:V/A-type H+-transporting ATPase subunit I